MSERLPTYAISHGGGPWPWIKEHMPIDWTPLETALASVRTELGVAPRAVLVVTAHWEASAFTLQGSAQPTMLYDYGGFPPETYQIRYPAPGDPALADQAIDLLRAAGLPTARDDDRGFDHGTFVPMYVMFPDADVPIVQISILRSFDPEAHLAAGRALAPLRDDGVLIVGSGLPSYHNLSQFGRGSSQPSHAFDAWLTETVTGTAPSERTRRLIDWDRAPSAREAHPREEHLLPLLVAVGAAEHEVGVRNYHESGFFGGNIASSSYRLGALPQFTAAGV
jgi:aromatic ring-opening dioxygenase catalytic subunit (LigB family)